MRSIPDSIPAVELCIVCMWSSSASCYGSVPCFDYNYPHAVVSVAADSVVDSAAESAVDTHHCHWCRGKN